MGGGWAAVWGHVLCCWTSGLRNWHRDTAHHRKVKEHPDRQGAPTHHGRGEDPVTSCETHQQCAVLVCVY